MIVFFFFFQAEDGIRDADVTGVQTCALPISADLVRRALLSVQLAGINQAVAKDPGAISFPVEIHRDGPGHLAIVDLPYGVEAADVIARRGRLASGLRLPLDQVWPEPAPGHTGRLALWV